MVIAIAWWVDGHRWRSIVGAALGTAGVISYAWVATESTRRDLRLAVDPQTSSDPIARAVRWMFVDYTRAGSVNSAHHVIVVVICVVAIGLGAWGLTTDSS